MTVTPEQVARAADGLRAGELVAFPTETVYGLGADASSPAALARLYAVKGRPLDHPVIVHVPTIDAVGEWAVRVPDVALRLASSCWPGPLTLVLRRAPGVLDAVTGGQGTVAVRVPDQPVALDLLRAFGGGVAAPSANRFGRVSATTAADVRADLGDDVAIVLDGGPCRVGVESTIVDCSRGALRVLRLGGIAPEDIEVITGERVQLPRRDVRVRAPGTLASHYAPRARVVVVEPMHSIAAVDDELARGHRVGVILADSAVFSPVNPDVSVLGTPCGPAEYARDLYRMLRTADERGLDVVVAIAPADAQGIGAAVADRLRRAAAPRPSSGTDGT